METVSSERIVLKRTKDRHRVRLNLQHRLKSRVLAKSALQAIYIFTMWVV